MKVGFGILGAGMISGIHADALRNSQKAELAAVCDLDRSRAEKLAAEYAPKAKIYTDLGDMLSDTNVGVIDVVTPNHLHADAVLAAAAAGKHVLCEKPPAMSLANVDRMIDACRRAGRLFGIFVQCRVREPIRRIKEAIDAGRFGRILRADAVMKWYRSGEYYLSDAWRGDRRSGAGVTIQHAFHYIDLLQYLAGPAKTVEARMTNLAHPQVKLEDTLDVRIEFASGAIGTVAASTALWPGSDVRIEIYGERGAAVAAGAAMSLWQFQEERPEDAAIRACGDSAQATAGSNPTALPSADHLAVIDDFIDAVRANREPVIPCYTVRPSLEIALAMYQSAKLNQPIELPLTNENNCW